MHVVHHRTASPHHFREGSTPTSTFNQPFIPLSFNVSAQHTSCGSKRGLQMIACHSVPRAEPRCPVIPSKISKTQPRPSNSASSSTTNTTELTEPPSPPRITTSRSIQADARASALPSAADDQIIEQGDGCGAALPSAAYQ